MTMFFGNSLWQLIVQSDAVSKAVLLILLGLSIASWTIFLYKCILLRIKRQQLKSAIAQLKTMHSLGELAMFARTISRTLPGHYLAKNLSTLSRMTSAPGAPKKLDDLSWAIFQQTGAQLLDDMVATEESYLAMLSTNAQVSPLLGLFGTVWGLVHAFIRISQKQSADITTVAPGIAEALITTLGGLLVAIPALVMFNYLNGQVRVIEQQLFSVADKLNLIVQHSFTGHAPTVDGVLESPGKESHGSLWPQTEA